MKLEFLMIHCTATPEGREVTAEDIRKWHIEGRGWRRVGYTDLIQLDGRIVNLTPFDQDDEVESWELTNGARGMNGISRHIVYSGGMDKDYKYAKDTRTEEQEYVMRAYVIETVARYPEIKVCGHNQFANKACPSFDVPSWLLGIIPQKNIYEKTV